MASSHLDPWLLLSLTCSLECRTGESLAMIRLLNVCKLESSMLDWNFISHPKISPHGLEWSCIKNFKENLRRINELKKINIGTAKFGITSFADSSRE